MNTKLISLVQQNVSLNERHKLLTESVSVTMSTLSSQSQDYEKCVDTYNLNEKSLEVVKKIIDEISKKGLGYLEILVTKGLRTIFIDDEYSFKIELTDRGASKATKFYIIDKFNQSRLLEDGGGGIQTIIAFIFRIYFILKFKLCRFVVLDEYFPALSEEYRDGLIEFLKSLCEDLQFKFLWISQNRSFADKVDRVYFVKNGEATLL